MRIKIIDCTNNIHKIPYNKDLLRFKLTYMIAIDNKQVTKKLFEYMIIIIKNTIKVMRDTMND